MQSILSLIGLSKQEPEHVEIVRLRTSYWRSGSSLCMKQEIRYLRRRSKGHDCLLDDASMTGAELVIPRITNLSSCKDGLYQVVICNEHKDWETGMVYDYDYELIPYVK